jgi:hypothetical protein
MKKKSKLTKFVLTNQLVSQEIIATGVCIYEGLALRETAQLDGKVKGTLKKGAKLEFTKIEERGRYKFGFVASKMLWVVITLGNTKFVELD